ATAFAMIVPFFLWGNPSGHDFEFHLNSWMEVLAQWKQGIVFPAWAELAHFGFGEARFIFYPPLSWTLGAALGAVLPWKVVPGAYVWIALSLSGCSMFILARRWLTARDAIFAAVLYVVNPYYIVIVYWRSAFAELLAGALLPLLLVAVLRSKERYSRTIIPLALIIAAAWLTNIPSAVMVTYSLALLLVLAAAFERKPRILLEDGLAILLGIGIASFYLLPVLHEQKWINIAQVLSPGVRPQDNFLFTLSADPDHNRFNWFVSAVATGQVCVLALAAFLARRKSGTSLEFCYLIMWMVFASLLMFPVTLFAWEHFPELQFIQFPWRWLLCTNVGVAALVPIAWRRWTPRLLLFAAMLGLLIFISNRFQPPWWDTAADIAEMLDNQVTGQGYEGTDEYVPSHADPSEVKQDAPLVSAIGPNPVRIQRQQWTAKSKSFSASTTAAGQLVLRLFNYPAWKAEVNGEQVSTETQEETGQMLIPVHAGENNVQITLTTTKDRIWGRVVSALSLFALAVLFFLQRRNRWQLAH
ncbi:MAG: hypothetical protein JWO91_3123, partial [Acidobacteriaceae bacterium]|nr:hypothetical protein [Acidobacteriaceae bacterium]